MPHPQALSSHCGHRVEPPGGFSPPWCHRHGLVALGDAYFRLAPPLLNRFEKQIFLRKDLMTKADEALLTRVGKFWQTLNECPGC